MKNTFIEFDGYCPESKLKGEKIEMKLNEMDFWESEKTGLQITIFPPYAVVLRFRGKGEFRNSKQVASNKCKGLLLVKSQEILGSEIFPDQNGVFYDSWDLQEYIYHIKY